MLFFKKLASEYKPQQRQTHRQISNDSIQLNNYRQVSGDKGSLLDGSLTMLVQHIENDHMIKEKKKRGRGGLVWL